MVVEAERLVCTNQECRAEIIVVKKPAFEKQNFCCACGSVLKRIYHPPKVTVLGKGADIFRSFDESNKSGHSSAYRTADDDLGKKSRASSYLLGSS